LHFKREDEGGAAHIVSNGTSLVGSNGFGKSRRQVPGAEPVDNLPPGATPANAPATRPAESDENLSKAALKNKKKREAKKAKDAEAKALGLAAAPDGPANTSERRSPERRDRRTHERSRSKGGQEVNQISQQTPRGPSHGKSNGSAPIASMSTLSIDPSQAQPNPTTEPPELSVTSPGGGSPSAKKLRGLQKKIRAIEDLEMRLAGGEKLEDTQMKKIATKVAVQQELDALERA
jgi:translation initiation factor 2A